MTLARLLCLGFLFWWSAISPTDAQTTLPVRSGEHAEFTRLVIRIPEANPWRVEASRGRAVLFVEGPPLRFDVSQSFARIPRTRLRNLIATENRLELELACDCAIRAAEDVPEFLVIDIHDPAAEPSRQTTASHRPRPRPIQIVSQDQRPVLVADRAGISLAQRLRGSESEPEHVLDLSVQGSSSMLDALSSEVALQVPEPPPVMFSAELGRIISNSVAQGLLVPAERAQSLQGAPSDPSLYSSPLAIGQIDAHIHVASDATRANKASGTGAEHEACRLFARIDPTLNDAGHEDTVHLKASALLHDALDQVNRESVLAHIRGLVAAGFGAEASLHANLLDPRDPARAMLSAMGQIIDHGPAEHDGLSSLKTCGPAGTLWGFLGTAADRRATIISHELLVQATASLPRELRIILAPHVVQALLDAGHSDAARRVGASVDRLALAPTPSQRLLRAALVLAEPERGSQSVMQDMAAQDMSDDVLLLVLQRSHERAEVVGPALLSIAQDRLFALRGDPLGQKLARLLSYALARAGDHGAAFALARDRQAALPPTEVMTLTRDLLGLVTADGTDADFVVIAFEQRPWERSDLGAGLVAAMSDRLTLLGFAEQADLFRRNASQQAPERENPSDHDAVGMPALTTLRTVSDPLALAAEIGDRQGVEVAHGLGMGDAPSQIVPEGILPGRKSSDNAQERDSQQVFVTDPRSLPANPMAHSEAVDAGAATGDARTANDRADISGRPEDEGASQTDTRTDPVPQFNGAADEPAGIAAARTVPETPLAAAATIPVNSVSALAAAAEDDTTGSGQQGVLAQTRALLEASAAFRTEVQAVLTDAQPGQDE